MATKTKPATTEEVARVMTALESTVADAQLALTCEHADPMNVEAVKWCGACALRRVERQSFAPAGANTVEQERFRAFQNALVLALVELNGAPVAKRIRDTTALARPIMHSWGW